MIIAELRGEFGMQAKMYKLRSVTVQNGTDATVELDLEFDGNRAFIIWDCIPVGPYQLKARVEIDMGLLQKVTRTSVDYVYNGKLVLPNPEHN